MGQSKPSICSHIYIYIKPCVCVHVKKCCCVIFSFVFHQVLFIFYKNIFHACPYMMSFEIPSPRDLSLLL